jgi:Zn finger protein HypA/HybF involved in hydrogenase expression
MFKSKQELLNYVVEQYVEVTDLRINENHWDLLCTTCKIVRGFQLVRRHVSGEISQYGNFSRDFAAPVVHLFRCPVCKSFKQWIIFELEFSQGEKKKTRYFRVTSLPPL